MGPGGERELQRRRFSGQEPWLMLVLPATDAGEAARGGGGGVFRCAKKSVRDERTRETLHRRAAD
jgi:hypothetical protein